MSNAREPFSHPPVDQSRPWEVPSASDTHDRSESELPTRETKRISHEEDVEVRAESILMEALSGGGVNREDMSQEENIDPQIVDPELSTSDLGVEDEIPVNHSKFIRM